MVLGGSGTPKNMLPSPDVLPAGVGIRLPTALRHGSCFEVNGSMELRSFTIKMYGRFREQDHNSLLVGLDRFRLYHPEASAFVSASGNADKGEVLDARDRTKQARTRPLTNFSGSGGGGGRSVGDSVPAHIPYLKTVDSESNPANFSAKAVWRFEHTNRSRAQ